MRTRLALRIRNQLDCPEKRRIYGERHFAVAAPRYDLATRALSLGRDAAWKARLIEALPDLPRPLCVDLACGTGDLAFLLARRYPGGRVVGVDLTAPMLDIARARNRLPNVGFLRQDLCALSFRDESVDIVTGGYALRNAPDLPLALAEIRRILRPGGTAAFLDFSRPRSAFPLPRYLVLRTWCGLWGLLLHGTPAVHGYIAPSLAVFPDREALSALFGVNGLSPVETKRFFGGIVELVVLRRADR